MKVTPRNFKKINLAFCVAAALSAFMANPAYSAEKVEKAIDLPVVIKPAPKKYGTAALSAGSWRNA